MFVKNLVVKLLSIASISGLTEIWECGYAVENRPDRTGAVNSRIIRQFENKSVHFKFSEGNSTSAAQFVLVNIHYG